MRKALFYLLSDTSPDEQLSAQEALACSLAAQRWRNGQRVLLFCCDQQQAERLDEALWQREPASFAPHNLVGEGPRYGAPVELAWPEKRASSSRDLLITLSPQFADFATAFHEVIDFVPNEDTLKQLARERYKAYRGAGFTLTTVTPPEPEASQVAADNIKDSDGQDI
ncbi:MAG: DNA polymerase III subunit chi [Enterobacteriaceae bacterium]